MSFYQPSLSLYDVLNALAEQPRYQRPQHHVHPFHGHGSMPVYYRFGNPYYYRPEYEEDGEDDEADEDMDGYERPFYYHDASGRNARAQLRQQQDQQQQYQQQQPQQQYQRGDTGLADLLNALVQGGVQGYSGEPGPANVQESLPEPQQPESHEDKKEAVPEKKAPTTSESKPKLKKRPSAAFLHQQAPSPVPDPLQLSKPETRMDLPFSPEVNVYDTPNTYTVIVALPGANSKAFRIDYHPSSHELLIKGNIEDKFGIGEKYLKITEVKYGAFERTVKFPVLPRIKDEDIKATYSNGLLQIKVPKILDGSEKPAPKKRIVIEDIPDEELEFEENPNPIQQ